VVLSTNAELFDAICSFQVIEHVANPAQFIRDMRRTLRPGGLLILAVPDMDGPVGKYFPFALTNIPPHHVSWWRKSIFHKEIAHFGFEVIDVRHEALPYYLWEYYLPKILEDKFKLRILSRYLVKNRETFRWIVNRLRKCGIKQIPGVRGHTLYVTLRRHDDISNGK
jgi:2-polyprenyl-3-methyl-5-hydroxy-6-metoxy-1,4-benzoquinol methylase